MREHFTTRKLRNLIYSGILTCFLLGSPPGADGADFHHPLDFHLSNAYQDDLPGLLKRAYIRVLITMNRTNFFLADGKVKGFEYALLKEYEKHLNQGSGPGKLKTTLEFIPVTRDRLLPGVVEGFGDIAAAGLTITEERRKMVAFTEPYLTGINEILVTYKKTKAPENLDELSGKRIFVRKSSSYYESLNALNRRLQKKNFSPVKIVMLDESLETEDILELVNTGALQRTVSDSHIAEIWSEVLDDIMVHENIKFREG
ncbi:MAG: transporter substrate-binding domain-containing protein, partial [Desulfobacterales bacterium]